MNLKIIVISIAIIFVAFIAYGTDFFTTSNQPKYMMNEDNHMDIDEMREEMEEMEEMEDIMTEKKGKNEEETEQENVTNISKVCGTTQTTPGASGFGEEPKPYSTRVMALQNNEIAGETYSNTEGEYEIELASGTYVIMEEAYGTRRTITLSGSGCTKVNFVVGFPSAGTN